MRMAGSHAIGVDVGGTKILAGVVNADGTVVRRRERATPTDSLDAFLAALEEAVKELLDEDIAAIGFGVPSPIDQRRGIVVQAPNIPPLRNVELRSRMSEGFGVPVGIDNDANAAAIAEWKVGAGRGADDLVMITLGTGCGGGLVLGGRPYRGATGGGAELGHMVIVHDGRPCQGVCTGRGHLEAYVSGTAATHAAEEMFGPAADAHRLVRLAGEGDEAARALLAEIGGYLGSAFETIANVFEPECIVVGGGFGIAGWDYIVPAAERVLRSHALRPGRDSVRVVRAELGTAAGLIGAAFVGFEALEGAVAGPA
jgi:glucokinase